MATQIVESAMDDPGILAEKTLQVELWQRAFSLIKEVKWIWEW